MKKKKSRAARAFPNTPVPAGRALTDTRKRKARPPGRVSSTMFLDTETAGLPDLRKRRGRAELAKVLK
jgi:hypothetical protein